MELLLRSHLGSEAYCFPFMVSAKGDLAYVVEEHDPGFPPVCDTPSLSPEDRVQMRQGTSYPLTSGIFGDVKGYQREKKPSKMKEGFLILEGG